MLPGSAHTPRPLFAIAAMAENRVIGAGGAIPWHLPEDFRFFKTTTMGHALVMGRKTFESIGRALPGRVTAVLSRNGFPGAPADVAVFSSWEALAAFAPERKLFLAGGAELYAQALPWCDGLFLTHVHAEPLGDAFFPDYAPWFDAGEVIQSCPRFTIRYHSRK
jgi:dihydrofolate reductase